MQIQIIHPKTRQKITVPATQVVVLDDLGRAIAVSYEVSPGMILHSDANDKDFGAFCAKNLGFRPEAPEQFSLKG